jgi:DNA-binding transcriptional regulator YiaG
MKKSLILRKFINSRYGKDFRKMTADQIKKIRINNNLTQQDMAELLGVKQQRISGWEAGTRRIPLYIVKALDCLRKAKKLKN